MATPRPVYMPETFTGTAREWSDWAEQFDLAADVNNWDETLKLKFMALLLSGRARDIYSGIPESAKRSYTELKAAMARCLEPCDSDDWSRATFMSRKRLHEETAREFGNALRRLVTRAYPSADEPTRDLLARDHFVSHFAEGDFRISLRSNKPKTLEEAIDLASEMELLRSLEKTHLTSEAKVRGVSEQKSKSDEQMETLLGIVEGLRQEVKSLKTTVQTFQANPSGSAKPAVVAETSIPAAFKRNSRDQGGGCWECNCIHHIRRDCPYLKPN